MSHTFMTSRRPTAVAARKRCSWTCSHVVGITGGGEGGGEYLGPDPEARLDFCAAMLMFLHLDERAT